jgi:ABC-2 type transport system ATP-binding protein
MNKIEPVISVSHLTKKYSSGRGIFDISFDIYPGTVFGYCGTNGSGKTTTIRTIMGFLKPDQGSVKVKGLNAWKNAEEIKHYVGYIPGEINFPDVMSGSDFLEIQAKLVGLTNMERANYIIKKMQLDPTANLKRMSKGMKQKTAIAEAFMNEPEILILDEPTTGLDPLMRKAFVDLVLEEKAKGKTIFMSSHMFEEMEDTCDYVGLIKDGHLIDVVDMKSFANRKDKEYLIGFNSINDYADFLKEKITIKDTNENKKQIVVTININDTNALFKILEHYNIAYIEENKYTLEQYFDDAIAKGE